MKTAFFDMDCSLVKFDEEMVRRLKTLQAPEEVVDYSHGTYPLNDRPHLKARINMIMEVPEFWKCLEINLNGWAALSRLRTLGYDVVILTKAPFFGGSSAYKEKADWIHEHIGNVPLIIVNHGKHHQRGELIYDDHPKYVHDFLESNPDAKAIMPIRSWNKHLIAEKNPRVLMWDEANLGEIESFLSKPKDIVGLTDDLNKINEIKQTKDVSVVTFLSKTQAHYWKNKKLFEGLQYDEGSIGWKYGYVIWNRNAKKAERPA